MEEKGKGLLSKFKKPSMGKRGYDVIRRRFFVEELEDDRRPQFCWFSDFEEYYSFVGGKIYKNACYYQCDLALYTRRKIDVKKIRKCYQIQNTIDDYSFDPNEITKKVYKKSVDIKKLCEKWDVKFLNCDTLDALEILELFYR